MEHVELITTKARLNLTSQCWSQVFVMYAYLWRGQHQFKELEQMLLQDKQMRKKKQVIFKSYALYTDCISEINNTQIDNSKDLDVVIPMYNWIDYSDNYAKISGSLWNTIRLCQYANIIYYETFKFKARITESTPVDSNAKDLEIAVPLQYITNFLRAFEVLINCKINLMLTITTTEIKIPTKCFWSPYKNDIRTYNNIQKLGTAKGDDYTTGWQLDYHFLKEIHKM